MAEKKSNTLYVKKNNGNAFSNGLLGNAQQRGMTAWDQRMADLGQNGAGNLQTGETAGNGALGWLKDSFDAGFASSLGGTARLAGEFSPVGNDMLNSFADRMDQIAVNNSPQAGQELNGLDYVSSAIGNALGSGAATMLEAGALAAGAKALGAGALASSVFGAAKAKPIIGTVAKGAEALWKSPYGKYLVANVAGSPLEAAAEAGNLITDMRREQAEKGYTDDDIRAAALRSAALNTAWLTGANMAEAGILGKVAGALGKGITKKGAKNIAKQALLGAGTGAISEGGEEYVQNLIGDYSKRAELGDLNYDEALEAAKMGAIGGGFLGGVGSGISGYLNRNALLTGTNDEAKAKFNDSDYDSLEGSIKAEGKKSNMDDYANMQTISFTNPEDNTPESIYSAYLNGVITKDAAQALMAKANTNTIVQKQTLTPDQYLAEKNGFTSEQLGETTLNNQGVDNKYIDAFAGAVDIARRKDLGQKAAEQVRNTDTRKGVMPPISLAGETSSDPLSTAFYGALKPDGNVLTSKGFVAGYGKANNGLNTKERNKQAKGNKTNQAIQFAQDAAGLNQANMLIGASRSVRDMANATQLALASRQTGAKLQPGFEAPQQATDNVNATVDRLMVEQAVNNAFDSQKPFMPPEAYSVDRKEEAQKLTDIINAIAAKEWDKAEMQPELQKVWNQPFVPQRQSVYNGALRRNLAALDNVQPDELPTVNRGTDEWNIKAANAQVLREQTLPTKREQAKNKQFDVPQLLGPNMPAKKRTPSNPLVRGAIDRAREGREQRARDKRYKEIKQDIIDYISTYPNTEDQLKALKEARQTNIDGLHELLQPTYDKLVDGMGNGVVDEYKNRETGLVEDLSGLKKGAEERKNNSTGYERQRFSLNAKWYSEWIREYNRRPNKAELYDLAETYYLGKEEIKDAAASWYDGTQEAESLRKQREAEVAEYHDYIDACNVIAGEIKLGKNYYNPNAGKLKQSEEQKGETNADQGQQNQDVQEQVPQKVDTEQSQAGENQEVNSVAADNTKTQSNQSQKPVETEKAAVEQSDKIGAVSKIDDFKHTKTGEMIPAAKLDRVFETAEFADARRIARQNGGDWNGYASKALKERGVFLFAKGGAEGRDNFIQTINGKYGEADTKAAEVNNAALPLTKPKGEQFKQIESYFNLWTNAFKDKGKGKVFMIEASATIAHIENLTDNATEALKNNNFDEFDANMRVAVNMIRDLKGRYEEAYRSGQPFKVADSKHLEMVNGLMDSWAKDYENQISKAKNANKKPDAGTFANNSDIIFNSDAVETLPKPAKDIIKQMPTDNGNTNNQGETQTKPQTKPNDKKGSKYDYGDKNQAVNDLLGTLGLKKKKDKVSDVEGIDYSDDGLDEAFKDLNKELSKLSANPVFNPALYRAAAKVGLILLKRAGKTFAKWAKMMLDTFKKSNPENEEKIKPYLGAIYKNIENWPGDLEFKDDTVEAACRVVGGYYSEGLTNFDDIYKALSDNAGEEVASQLKGYLQQAFYAIDELENPTLSVDDNVVKSNVGNTTKGDGNNGVHGQAVQDGRTEGSGAAGSGVSSSGPTVRSGEIGDRTADSVLGEEQTENGSKVEQVGNNEGIRVYENKPSGRPAGGKPEQGNVYNGSKGRSGQNETDVAGVDGRRNPGTAGGRSGVITNYHIDDPDALIGGTPMVRFLRNKKAIEVVQELLDNDRPATKEERDAMAAYTGWGSFGQELFKGTWEKPIYKDGWKEENDWLRETLGKEAWVEAQNSIINAHYTDPYTINAMWNMAKQMGFKGGKVLEPSMGVGNFFGLMPKDIAEKSQLTGIELDRTTGRMAQALYPQANIQIKGYQDSLVPDNFYDLIIGNVPFGNFSIADRKYGKLKPLIHDFFFLKGIDQLKPGGLMMAITSKGSLDKADARVRMELAQKADLVAAFRLPTGAFDKYAGTNVVTDILIFKKLETPRAGVNNIPWVKSSKYEINFKGKDETYYYNDYYKEHPENILGVMEFGHGTTTGRPGLTVRRLDNFGEKLKELSKQVPRNIFSANKTKDNVQYISNHQGGEQGSLVIGKDDNKLYTVYGEQLKPLQDTKSYAVKNQKTTEKREQEFRDWLELRDVLGQLYDAERNDSPNIEELRSKLNEIFDSYNKNYVENIPAKKLKDNQPAFRQSFANKYLKSIEEPSSARIMALVDDKGQKAAIFSKRSVRGSNVNIKNPTIAQALIMQRNENVSNLDIDRIAQLSKKNKAEVISELTKSGTIFKTPAGNYEVKDVYLAGNVRQKLREAEDALQSGDKDMQINIEELKKVIPATVPYYNISTSLGATWIPQSVYKDFVAYLLGVSGTDGINIVKTKGFTVDFDNKQYNHLSNATTVYGINDIAFNKLLTHAFNHTKPLITTRDANRNVVEDTKAMEAANDKLEKIYDAFNDWLWKDNSRKLQLENEYNEIMNAIAVPTYDGSFMDMPGMALLRGDSQFSLRKHQLNAIYRGLINGSGVYAHEVGTGKTYTMAGLAVESRRYGLAKKPLLLAFNANSASVAKEINDMYPGAKVLYIDNMDRSNIQLKLNQIRTDDWDCVVMPHSLVDKLSFQEETLMNMAEKQIYALEQAAIEAAAQDGEKLTVEQMEKLRTADKDEKIKIVRNQTAKKLVTMRNQIINQIKQNALNASAEDAIPFEELGIDMVLVDEAHAFKKPPFTTTRKIKGLTTESSDRAIQLSFLTQYIQSINNGRGVHLFTGTPITNTLTEMYHMMRYVMPKAMEDANIIDFDSWMNSFAEETADMEFTSTGDVEMVSRLASFTNVPELRRFVGQYWDTVFADDMPEFSPRKTVSGKTITDKLTEEENNELLNGYTKNPQGRPYKKVVIETLKLTSAQNVILKDLVAKAKEYKEAGKQKRKLIAKSVFHGTPLLIGNDASLAGMDPRLYDLNINTEGEETKIDRCVSNVVRIYNEGTATAPTVQVIFSDVGYKDTKKRSVPVQTGLDEWKSVQEVVPTFNMSKAIVQKLVEKGIPENEIIIMKSSYSAEKRAQIADMLKVGKYRVVIGSTATLGVGVNMQDSLRAMHHLDCPWMPGDLVQRNGRGHRQGNHWNTVLEYRYVTEKLDTKRWQTVLRKDAFINSFMKSKIGDNAIRSFEMGADDLNDKDTDSDLLQTLSDASGDPRVLIQKKYEINLAKLKRKERTFVAGIEDVKAKLGAIDNTISSRKTAWDNLAADAKTFAENKKDTFSIKLVNSLKSGQNRNLVTFDSRVEAQKHLEELLKQVANIGTDNHIGEYTGFSLEVRKEQSTVDGTYIPVIRINGQGEYTCGTPTINGITANAGNIPGKVGKAQELYQQAVNDKAILQKAVKETFPQQELLDKTERQLEEIKQDRLLSPTPPPTWLTDGVTLSSTFYINGNPFSLVGYRANSDGYYLVGEYNGKQTVFPFQDATDIQGMPIYDMTNHVPSPAYKPPEIPKDVNTQSARKYSVGQLNSIRPKAEIEAEIRNAFPNGTISYENGVPVVTLPNGAKFQYSIRENIIVNTREQKKADTAHGTSGGVIQGFWQKFSGNGVQRLLAVAQNSERGTAFHEAMHAAIDLALTEKEANALRKHYQNEANKQNRNVDEVIADAYRDWVLARQQKRGTAFGKLWQKIKDFCVRIRALFDNGAEVKRIMQDVESGKVYERGTSNSNIRKRVYFSKVEIEAQKGSGTTQVPNTRGMYVKALSWLRNELPGAKTVLDYGAGMGLGTEDMRSNNPDMDIECYEPNPQRWRGTKPPTYTNNTQINKDYDLILNTNVLNVVEKPIRDLIVQDIASHLNMGGKALITTRGWKVIIGETHNYKLADEYHAVWVDRGKMGLIFQKGFDTKELKNYIEELLGNDFVVEKTKPTFSNVSVVVTRVKPKANTNNAQNIAAPQEMPDTYKTLKGSAIKRSKYGVGKQMASQIYLHKNYVSDVIPKDVWEHALKVLKDTNSDFQYNCVMYDTKTGNVRFDEAPDFDTAREPIVGDTLTVKPDGTTKRGHSNYIWHHKWIWVKNDYKGFDVNESKAWSQKWLSVLTETADGNGLERWNAQLDRFNLEHDGENIQYSVAPQRNKIASAFTNTERKGTVENAKDFLKEHWKNFYSDFVDKNNVLHAFDALTKSKGGLSLYEQVQNLPSTTAGMLSAITEGTAKHIEAANQHLKNVKMKHKATLSMALNTINKATMDKAHPGYLRQNGFDSWVNAFGAYLGAERLLEMSDIAKAENETYKFPNGLTEKELRDFVQAAPVQFKKAADIFYKVNDNVISIMEDSQVFSHELAQTLRTKYKKYCPLLRDFSDTAAADTFLDGLTNGGRGIGNVSIPLKKISISGSERGVLNPLETVLKSYATMLNRAERNRVGLMAVKNAEQYGLDNLIQEVPEVKGKGGKVVNAVADPKNCIFTVLVNGQKKAYKTTQDLYGPIVGYNLPAASLVFGVARTAAKMLRTGATMSPSFIVRNIIRDTVFAGVASRNGFIPVLDTWRGAQALMNNPTRRAEFEAAGVTEFNFYGSKEQRIKSIDAMAGEKPVGIVEMIKWAFQHLEDVSAFAESATRMGEFMKARDKGLTMEEAARAAREVTLDFSRSGRVGEQINQVVPFFNACIQGGDKMVRLLKEDPRGTLTKLTKYIILPSLFLWAINHDDDWYKELDPDIKNNYWCLTKDIRVPKPQEAGVLFGSGIEALFEQASAKDPEAMKNWAKAFLSNMIPGVVPTLFLPILEWQANYSYFKGRQLVGNKYKNMPDELQYSDYTSELSKSIGNNLLVKLSPMKIDNLVRGYTGTMGYLLWSTPDSISNKAKDLPAKHWYEYYPIRDFAITDSNLSRSTNDFYDLMDRANKQHNGYGKKGSPDATTRAIRHAGTNIANIRKDIDRITKSKTISQDRKRQLIDIRKKKINEIAKRTVQRYGNKV